MDEDDNVGASGGSAVRDPPGMGTNPSPRDGAAPSVAVEGFHFQHRPESAALLAPEPEEGPGGSMEGDEDVGIMISGMNRPHGVDMVNGSQSDDGVEGGMDRQVSVKTSGIGYTVVKSALVGNEVPSGCESGCEPGLGPGLSPPPSPTVPTQPQSRNGVEGDVGRCPSLPPTHITRT